MSYAEALHMSASKYTSSRRTSTGRLGDHSQGVNGGSPSNKFAIAQRFGKDELRRRSQLEKTVNSAQWDEKKFQRICTPGAESNTRRSPTVYDGRQKRTHSFRIKYEGLFDLYPDFTGPRVHDPPNE